MSPCIDKQRIASSFSKAAVTYDSMAELQRVVGSELLGFLPESDQDVVMDLGCGTGFFTPKLKGKYPQASLINLDLALGMLNFAKANRPADKATWVCGDAEQLPLANKSIDLIFSTLAIQWCEDLTVLFNEIKRVLKPGGRFVFTTLGPSTLKELKQAWTEADALVHVNQFTSEQLIRDSLSDGLNLQSLHEDSKVLKYRELKELTDELKGIGAHNMNSGQQVGLMGRDKIRRFKSAYENQRLDDGLLPATYQVFYIVLEKQLEN